MGNPILEFDLVAEAGERGEQIRGGDQVVISNDAYVVKVVVESSFQVDRYLLLRLCEAPAAWC